MRCRRVQFHPHQAHRLLLDWSLPDHLSIDTKSWQFLPFQRSTNGPRAGLALVTNPRSLPRPERPDCMAGLVGFELPNVTF